MPVGLVINGRYNPCSEGAPEGRSDWRESMPGACRRIGELVTRIQNAFLDNPGLTLTAPQARKRFGMDAAHSRALFELLTDAGVLVAIAEGGEIRYRLPQRQTLHETSTVSRAPVDGRGFDSKPMDTTAA